jgi:hypothetical protein
MSSLASRLVGLTALPQMLEIGRGFAFSIPRNVDVSSCVNLLLAPREEVPNTGDRADGRPGDEQTGNPTIRGDSCPCVAGRSGKKQGSD